MWFFCRTSFKHWFGSIVILWCKSYIIYWVFFSVSGQDPVKKLMFRYNNPLYISGVSKTPFFILKSIFRQIVRLSIKFEFSNPCGIFIRLDWARKPEFCINFRMWNRKSQGLVLRIPRRIRIIYNLYAMETFI